MKTFLKFAWFFPLTFIAFGFADCTKNESTTISGADGAEINVTEVVIAGNDAPVTSNDVNDSSDNSTTDNSQTDNSNAGEGEG